MKKLLFEILLFLIVPSLLGLLYNSLQIKPLPLIYEKPIVHYADDSELINPFENPQIHNEKITIASKVENTSTTISKPKEIKIIDETKSKNKAKEIDNSKNVNFTEIPKGTVNELPPKPEDIVKIVSYEQITKLLNNPNFIFVDAREEDKFKQGHIGNSLNIFPLEEDKNKYFPKLLNLPKDKNIVVYCDGGNCDLSHDVCNDLVNFGYRKIFLFAGGWEEWTKHK